MTYKATIGLEIHVELKTKSKMFCACSNSSNSNKANTNICPICTGQPGTLPVLNKEAILKVLKVGHALKGNIADYTEWDRKNYFYPDIPKGYQISQYKYPLVSGGELAGVKITRIHLEEDTAKSTHDSSNTHSLIDFNRAGVPLMELVTEPVIHDAKTAGNFGRELQLLLRYLDVSDANMENGDMRVEANISVSSTDAFGTKTEVKNLNSFRSVERAIEYEIERQTALLERGEEVIQETRGWDDGSGKTFSQRKKENSHDYRYFPDPDIPKLKISEIAEFESSKIIKNLPEMPWDKRLRLRETYSLNESEVNMIVSIPGLANFLEETGSIIENKHGNKDKEIKRLTASYLVSDFVGLIKKDFGEGIDNGLLNSKIKPEEFSELIVIINKGLISSRSGKDILLEMYINGGSPENIAKSKDLVITSSKDDAIKAIKNVIDSNKVQVTDYKNGKKALLQFFVGMVMKEMKGKADPKTLPKMIEEELRSS